MKEIYAIMEFVPLIVIALSLILTWKVPTARWLLVCYGIVEVMTVLFMPTMMQWKTHFYLFDLLLCLAFILPIIYGRRAALFLYSKTKVEYFSLVYKRQTLSVQECGIIVFMMLACFANLITWLEILAYKYYWIDVPYFKLYVRDNTMLLLHIALCGAIFTYAIKAEKREKDYLKYDSVEH
ncbi:hypothetical protein JL49_20165 [Pseudoalteromonas luteoviolacea]|nr:hypothetical protein JL49_20165 [Pseudoalteromonas luteoviolacea]